MSRREAQLVDEVIRAARGCPPAQALAAYREGTPEEDRARLESHLRGCAPCRAALDHLDFPGGEPPEEGAIPADVARRLDDRIEALRREPAPARGAGAAPWMKLAAGILLVSAVALAGYLWLGPDRSDDDLGAPRGGEALETIAPAGALAEPPEAFLWTAHPGAASYQILVFDEAMEEVWSATTEGTRLAAPEEIRERLARGGRFSWQVLALDRREAPIEGSAVRHFAIGAGTGR
jgi:hypothetical protein